MITKITYLYLSYPHTTTSPPPQNKGLNNHLKSNKPTTHTNGKATCQNTESHHMCTLLHSTKILKLLYPLYQV